MKFGAIATRDAEGAILAHSMAVAAKRIGKGARLTQADCDALLEAGHDDVVVAILEAGDIHEDEAATRLSVALAGSEKPGGLRIEDAFTGRVNLRSDGGGLLVVDKHAIDAANAIDEAITIATLPEYARVEKGRMVATVKMIPFAVDAAALGRVCEAASGAIRLAPFRPLKVGLVATELPSLKPSVMKKTAKLLASRIAAYGGSVVKEVRCAHDADAVAGAIAELDALDTDLTVVFGASAIVDRRDEVPSGIEQSGGEVLHFGMPVDPGNLLLLANRHGKPVLGAPGCARSPKENGFDWVLDRIAAGIEVTPADVSGMGVGGLLMEIPSRPQPRAGKVASETDDKIGAIVLAAGRSSRMGGPHKLLESVGGRPLVRRSVEAILVSKASPVVVVTGHRSGDVEAALEGLDVACVHNPDYAQGLSTSLARGLAALPENIAGAAICLADMPGVDAGLIGKLADAFNDAPEGAIVVPTVEGKRGNPVIWARRYFETLSSVSGDVGGRALIGENASSVIEVAVDGDAALADIDTPEALQSARKTYGG